jgi:hypothetical protein
MMDCCREDDAAAARGRRTMSNPYIHVAFLPAQKSQICSKSSFLTHSHCWKYCSATFAPCIRNSNTTLTFTHKTRTRLNDFCPDTVTIKSRIPSLATAHTHIHYPLKRRAPDQIFLPSPPSLTPHPAEPPVLPCQYPIKSTEPIPTEIAYYTGYGRYAARNLPIIPS